MAVSSIAASWLDKPANAPPMLRYRLRIATRSQRDRSGRHNYFTTDRRRGAQSERYADRAVPAPRNSCAMASIDLTAVVQAAREREAEPSRYAQISSELRTAQRPTRLNRADDSRRSVSSRSASGSAPDRRAPHRTHRGARPSDD